MARLKDYYQNEAVPVLAEKFGYGQTTVNHSRECRIRIKEALKQTPQGQKRLENEEERLNLKRVKQNYLPFIN